MNVKGMIVAGASVLALGVLATTAHAQDTTAEPADANSQVEGLGDIVVTAQRREESAQKVSIAMTVLGEDLIKDNVRNISDLAKYSPNIKLENPLGFGIPRTGIRGISQSDFNANATTSNMVYLDDVPLNSVLAQGVPLWDISRAEVLRGPQGTLFGRNATGGALRYIAETPGSSLEGYADLTLGSYGHREMRAAIGGPLTDTLGARISFLGVTRTGDYRNITLNETQGEKNYWGVRAVLEWQPADAVTVALRGQYFKSNQDLFAWKSTPGLASRNGFGPAPPLVNGFTSVAAIQAAYGFINRGPETNFKVAESDLDPNEHMEHIPVALNFDVDLGGVTLTSVSSYLKVNQDYLLDLDSTPAPILTGYAQHHLRQWTQELRLASNNDGPFNWIAGAFFIDEKIRAREYYQASAFIGNVNYGFPSADSILYWRSYDPQKTKSYAFFAHTTYDITPELKLTAAARWTHEKKSISYIFRSYWEFPSVAPRTVAESLDFIKAVDSGNLGTQLAPANAPLSAEESWNRLSWKLGLDYELAPRTMLYAFVARGFKGGSFVSSPNTRSQVLRADGTVFSARPEIITDYELGIKSDVTGSLRVNASAFYYDYRDYQTNQFVMATQILSNLPKARVLGFEMEANWVPVDQLRVNVGLGITDSKITKALDPTLEGKKLPLAEDFNFNGSISYRIDTGIGSFTPEFSGKYEGKYFQTKENIRELGGHWTLNARLGYQTDDERFYGSVWIRNLTNNVYPSVVSDAAEFFGTDIAYLNERRLFGATAGVRF